MITDEQRVHLASLIHNLDKANGEQRKTMEKELRELSGVKGGKEKKERKGKRASKSEKTTSKSTSKSEDSQLIKSADSNLAKLISRMERGYDIDIVVQAHERTYDRQETHYKQDVEGRKGILTISRILHTGLIKIVSERLSLTGSQKNNLLSGRGAIYRIQKARHSPQFMGQYFGYILLAPTKTGMVYKTYYDISAMKRSYLNRDTIAKKVKKVILDDFNKYLNGRKATIEEESADF